jgi:EAL domain-containing protein (putative c-di-GMP-specific phosphodiesterase class I)
VVAEFVETASIAEMLKALDVKWGQGFLYHKPEALTYDALLAHLK